MAQDWVVVANLVRPRGIRGEVVAEAANWTAGQLLSFPRLVVFPGERAIALEHAFPHQDRMVLKFAGIDSVEQAEGLREGRLCIPREDRPPAPEGEVYYNDLIGCRVFDYKTGRELGTVADYLEYGGPVLLQTMAGTRELLIPFVPAICRETDLEGKRIVADLPEGFEAL
ncbi:MAG: 16S rRNA processing protein RimM [Bryobacterales bacterium]|nr:16S rRNA processing protein RimM [Bryobacterales bacterium]